MAITPGFLGIDEPATIDKRADANAMTRAAAAVLREAVSVGSPNDATPEQIADCPVAPPASGDAGLAVRLVPQAATEVAKVAQGTAAAAATAWPVKPTDAAGVNQQAITATGDAKVTLDGEAVVLGAGTADIGDVTVLNGAGAAAVNIQDGGNAITVDGTVTANAGTGTRDVQGNVAHDAPDGTSNPIKVGGKAADVAPTAVAAADRVDAYFDRQGRQITRPWGAGSWSQVHFPAANTRATTTRAAGAAGNRHVCTGFTVVLAGGATAPGAVQLDVRLRDGIADTGTILWQAVITLPATAGAMNGITRSGLFIEGTPATAMTLEFSAAGGANTFESVSMEGVSIVEA